MSSIVKVASTWAPLTGLPFFETRTEKAFGTAALFGVTRSWRRYAPRFVRG